MICQDNQKQKFQSSKGFHQHTQDLKSSKIGSDFLSCLILKDDGGRKPYIIKGKVESELIIEQVRCLDP